MTMLAAALEMASRGWWIFPCEPRGKRPAGALAPHGLNDATDDLDMVRDWWTREPDANIGLATGRRSGVIVIDLDGPAAEEAYGVLLLRHGNPGSPAAPDGATVRTGKGWHIYLAPGDSDIRNSASRIAQGIDVRGDGGYVVAPPSIHPNGGVYVWCDPVPKDGLPAVSDEWAEILAPPPPPPRVAMPKPKGYSGVATPYGTAAMIGLLTQLESAGDGSRNDTLNYITWRAVHLAEGGHLDLHAALSQIASSALSIGLEPYEVEGTMRSARDAVQKPAA